MVDVVDSGEANWVFDYIWPRIEHSLERSAVDVRARIPTVRFDASAVKRQGNRFGVAAEFSNDLYEDGPTEDVIIILNCGTFMELRSNYSISVKWERSVCRSQVGERIQGRSRTVVMGPSVEFRLDDKQRAKQTLDKWIDATAVFIDSNTELIVEELKSVE